MVTSDITKISPQGKISLIKMYDLIFFLETGLRPMVRISRVPAKARKEIITKYNLVYNKSIGQYIGNEDEIFNKLKEEFPDMFEKYNITDWWKLMEVHGNI